ncbi:MAG: hypothetical protein KDJ88_18550, partial [Bauldia sp.]|nr:hypothetical protein [Bauldia sp.]
MPIGPTIVTNETELRTAILNGEDIQFANDITLTADLPAIQSSITIDGAGFTLNGDNTYRGLFIGAWQTGTDTQIAVSVTIHDLEIENAVAIGGNGADGGGGGAGLGGAIFVANMATVTVSDVSLVGNAAMGGDGSAIISNPGGGGGGM